MNDAAIELHSASHSQRTRDGITQARKRGVAWGSHGKALAERNRKDAASFAETLRSVIRDLKLAGARGPTDLAKALNDTGVPSRNNGRWHPSSVHRLLKLLGPSLTAEVKALANAQVAEMKKVAGVP